jgi:filamentous hemagglutinin
LDETGSVVYKDQVLTKTVYDPSIISDDTIVKLGRQAAINGYPSAIARGAQAFNAEAGGISFRVYIDPKTGAITNYHPRS